MIGAAVVGLGWWGQNIAAQLAGSDRMRAVVGVDPDGGRRRAAGEQGLEGVATLEEALAHPGVDAVVLASPHRFHCDQVVAAARAGKHVFCEKPFAVTAAEADVALAAAAAAGVVVGIGHERRFEPAVVEMQERVRSGDLGVPLVFEGNFSQDKFLALPPDNWRLSAVEAPVGPLSATGIHLVDLAISVLGTPTEVWTRLSTRATGFGNGDTMVVTLGFESGSTAVITAVLTTPFVGRVCLIGSQGWYEVRDRNHPEEPRGWDVTTAHRGGEPQTRFFPPHPAVLDNLERFAAAVEGGPAYPVSTDDIRANARTFEAITRSARSGAVEAV